MKKGKIVQKEHSGIKTNHEKTKNYVYPVRDWKEYLGESLLIIFSVLLALSLTEYISKLHEKENTKSILKSISTELIHNKNAIREMQDYNLNVLGKIDSILLNKNLQKEVVSNSDINIKLFAPEGVLYRYLENVAWTIAKNNDIMSKLDIESISILTKVYEDQDRILKVEDEVAKVIFDRASRDPRQVRTTLVLIRDIYHGWAVDRVAGLFSEIDDALRKIEAYK
jgi:hypothetical protein